MSNNDINAPQQKPWEFPDGRQFLVYTENQKNQIGEEITARTLNEMRRTSGDLRDIVLDMYSNHDPNQLREPGLKGASAVAHDYEGRGIDPNLNAFEEEQALNNQKFEKDQQQQRQWEENQLLQKKDWLEKEQLKDRQLEEKLMQERAMENRPAEDSRNMGIGMLPLGFAGAMLGFGLTEKAVNTTGETLSPHAQALGDKMMVTGNDGGDLLAQARNALGITGPSTDTMVTGPNRTNEFIPGVAPEPNTLNAALNPLAPKNGALPTPGMTPTFG